MPNIVRSKSVNIPYTQEGAFNFEKMTNVSVAKHGRFISKSLLYQTEHKERGDKISQIFSNVLDKILTTFNQLKMALTHQKWMSDTKVTQKLDKKFEQIIYSLKLAIKNKGTKEIDTAQITSGVEEMKKIFGTLRDAGADKQNLNRLTALTVEIETLVLEVLEKQTEEPALGFSEQILENSLEEAEQLKKALTKLEKKLENAQHNVEIEARKVKEAEDNIAAFQEGYATLEKKEKEAVAKLQVAESQVQKAQVYVIRLESEIAQLQEGDSIKYQQDLRMQLTDAEENLHVARVRLQSLEEMLSLQQTTNQELTGQNTAFSKGFELVHKKMHTAETKLKKTEAELAAVQLKYDRLVQMRQKENIAKELKALPKRNIKNEGDNSLPGLVSILKKTKEAEIRVPAETLANEVKLLIDLAYGYPEFAKSLGKNQSMFLRSTFSSTDNKRLAALKNSSTYALEESVETPYVHALIAETDEVLGLVSKGFEQMGMELPKEIQEKMDDVVRFEGVVNDSLNPVGGFAAIKDRISAIKARKKQFDIDNPIVIREKAIEAPVDIRKDFETVKVKPAVIDAESLEHVVIDPSFDPRAIQQERLRQSIGKDALALVDSIYVEEAGFKNALGKYWGRFSTENQRLKEVQTLIVQESAVLEKEVMIALIDELIELIEKGYVQLKRDIPEQFANLMDNLVKNSDKLA